MEDEAEQNMSLDKKTTTLVSVFINSGLKIMSKQ